jgi:hypothetical protein
MAPIIIINVKMDVINVAVLEPNKMYNIIRKIVNKLSPTKYGTSDILIKYNTIPINIKNAPIVVTKVTKKRISSLSGASVKYWYRGIKLIKIQSNHPINIKNVFWYLVFK